MGKERWRWIKGHRGRYKISTQGRFKSVRRYRKGKSGLPVIVPERITRGTFDKRSGYFVVHLWKNNKPRTRAVHRLMAEAFLPNPDSLPEACHKDDVKTNNVIENLVWGTRLDNARMAQINGRYTGRKNRGFKLNPDDIPNIRHRLKKGESQISIARDYGIHPSNISDIYRGVAWAGY